MTTTCKHNESKDKIGLCWGCKANKKAAYDLTGTHDPEEQKQYWNDVWERVKKLRAAKFKRNLKNGTNF